MSYKTTNRQSSASQLKTLYKTDYLYNKMALQCHEDGLIKLTPKQAAKTASYLAAGPSYFGAFHVLSDSAGTTYKHAICTPALNGSPIQEQNTTSTKVMERMGTLKLLNFFAAKQTDTPVEAVMVTLSFQNADFGWLSDAKQSLKVIYTKLKDWIRRTCDFGSGVWLGIMPAMEVTVNKEHFKNGDEKQLYHPHLHLVIFFAGLTDHEIYSVRRQIFVKFSDLCKEAGVKNSSAAYDFEKTYQKGAKDKGSDQAPAETSTLGAMLEATKYVTKPEDTAMIGEAFEKENSGSGDDNGGDNFAEKVFAEIYNSRFAPTIHANSRYKNLKGKKPAQIRLRGAGTYELARSVYKAIAEAGLSGLFAFSPCDGDVSMIPHVFTRFATLILNKNWAKLQKSQTLTPAEVLHYNRDMLKMSIFPSHGQLQKAIATSCYSGTQKQKAVVDVLKNFVRWNSSVTDIDEVMTEWIETIVGALETSENPEPLQARLQDVQTLKDAIDSSLDSTQETPKEMLDIVKKVKGTATYQHFKSSQVALTYLPNDNDYGFLVRSFRDGDLVARLGQYAKKHFTPEQIDSFMEENADGSWSLNEQNEWIKPMIKVYVALTSGKTVSEKENSFNTDMTDINNWKTSQYDEGLQARPFNFIWLAMSYAAAKTAKARREAQLIASVMMPRDVVLEMPAEHFEKSIHHLMKATGTNNPLFKNLYTDTDTKAAA